MVERKPLGRPRGSRNRLRKATRKGSCIKWNCKFNKNTVVSLSVS